MVAQATFRAQSRRMSLFLDLADYDGKAVAPLETIRRIRSDDVTNVADAVALADAAEANVAIGATWLLRAWLEDGATMDAGLVSELGARLEHVLSPWAQLHLCQTVRFIEVPEPAAPAFATFRKPSPR